MIDIGPTTVIFRRWRGKGGTIIALFPEIPTNTDGSHCAAYEHVGQHSGACLPVVMTRTTPANMDEPDCQALHWELTKMGYLLNIRRRESHELRTSRLRAAAIGER